MDRDLGTKANGNGAGLEVAGRRFGGIAELLAAARDLVRGGRPYVDAKDVELIRAAAQHIEPPGERELDLKVWEAARAQRFTVPKEPDPPTPFDEALEAARIARDDAGLAINAAIEALHAAERDYRNVGRGERPRPAHERQREKLYDQIILARTARELAEHDWRRANARWLALTQNRRRWISDLDVRFAGCGCARCTGRETKPGNRPRDCIAVAKDDD